MNRNIRDSLFMAMLLGIMFTNIPKFIQINSLFGGFSRRLTVFFVFIGLVYTVFLVMKKKISLSKWKHFTYYSLVYILAVLVSLIWGLYEYPYYHLIFNGPTTQIDKLPSLLNVLNTYNFQIDQNVVVSIWMFIRFIKSAIFDYIYSFGCAYMIYLWYHQDAKQLVRIINRSVIISVIIICAYNILDLLYLAHVPLGKQLLSTINPWVHEIKNEGTWYPPLLWKNQLRSLFAEPSYYGIYGAFAMPFLWYKFIKNDGKMAFFSVLILFFTIGLFLTKARTGTVLFSVEVVALIGYAIYLRKKELLLKVLYIGSISTVAFITSLGFINYGTVVKDSQKASPFKIENVAKEYVEKNVTSVTSKETRSNKSRYTIMKTMAAIGLDHPILGVGKGLKDAYITDYLTPEDRKVKEVNRWAINQSKKGVLKSGYPSLGQYSTLFAEQGIIGIVIFLFPAGVLLWKLLKESLHKDSHLIYGTYFISLLGILISGIGDHINVTYAYWILLGAGFSILHSPITNENAIRS